jgi:hypothetical protein
MDLDLLDVTDQKTLVNSFLSRNRRGYGTDEPEYRGVLTPIRLVRSR